MHKINNNWYFEPKSGWYQISPNNLREEYLFKNTIKYNEIPLIFDRINIKWAKKNAKKYQNKLNFDFSRCNFSEKDILAFNDFIKHFPNIKSLNISFSPKITSKGYLNLSEGLKNLLNLSQIDLSSNNLNDEELKNFFKFLDKESKLNTINLSYNNLTSNGFTLLCKNISSNRLKIKEINVCGNKINDDGFRAFIEEVKVGTFNCLNKINFSNNLLGDETIHLFFSFFSNFVNLYEIDLSYNNITDNGVINFSAVINDLIDNISFIDLML